MLDCESIESTYKSLEDILGVKKSDLCQLFDSVEVYGKTRERYCESLFSYIQRKTDCKAHFDKTCWFHATCTWSGNTYEDGLLPTRQALNKIWDFQSALVKGQTTIPERIKSSNPGGDVHLYELKCHNGGPFGFLLRELAFVCDSTYVNYFDSPEIVEDIGLNELYHANTVPCIVKFRDQQTSTEQMCIALLYAYHDHHDIGLTYGGELAHSFDGENKTVPKDRILKVEFPTESEIATIRKRLRRKLS